MAKSSNQRLNLQEAIFQQALVYYEQLVERMQLIERVMPQVELVEQRIMSQAIDSDHEYQRWLNELPKLLAEQQKQFAEYQRRLATEIPERDRKALQRLGEEGWFLDPEMPAPLLQKIELLFDEHPDEMTEWLSNFFRTRLDVIEEALIDSYPRRGLLFQQAFEAHRERKYGLSIPVFLTQADGISWGRTRLFIFRQRKSTCKEDVSQNASQTPEAYLYPLSIILPLWMNQSQRASRGNSFAGLNRHQVLHGESVDYDTEPNSLKAISLLSYLNWIFSKDKRAGDG